MLTITKVDAEQQMVFGWANVAIRADGEQIEDSQGDMIDPGDLEQAAYHFVLDCRDAGVMHKGKAVGALVESFMVTPEKLDAMGLAKSALPGGWWVGFHIPDAGIFAKVKDGTYTMFSIQGLAMREAA